MQRSKAYVPKPVYRLDWFSPGLKGAIRSLPQTTSGGRPLPSTYKYDFGDSLSRRFNFDWYGRVEEKFSVVKEYVAGRKIKWREDHREWQQLFPLGSFDTRKPYEKRRHITNGLFGKYCSDAFGWSMANGTYGQTQSTEEFTAQSYATRLDRTPGAPDPEYAFKHAKCADTMYTDSGRQAWGSISLSTKEEVLKMVNLKGATGKFCRDGTMGQWIENNNDWYEQGLAVVSMWGNGQTTPTYWTIRNKKEAKLRKDIDVEGRLVQRTGASDRDLLEAGDMVPRQITFANEAVRVAHPIVLGRLLTLNLSHKVNKGSINGCPPYIVG